MADLFAGVPGSAGNAAGRERGAAAAQLAALQLDIEARLARSRRLVAQGSDGVPATPPDADVSTPAPAVVQSSPSSGALPGTAAEQCSEVDQERALTAFLERAVMSC